MSVATGRALQLGGIVLGTASQTASAAEADAIKDLVPFQPTTSRTFAATDTLRVYSRLFWGTKDASVDVTLTVPDSSVAPRAFTLTGMKDRRGKSEAVLDTTLPLAGLAPGKYQLDITAKIGKPTAKRVVPIEVR